MSLETTKPALLSIGTAVPNFELNQEVVGKWVANSLNASPALRRWISSLYKLSGIETRYSCLSDAADFTKESSFTPGTPLEQTPTTADRMKIYQREAVELGVQAAEQALNTPDFTQERDKVTHLIVVSCTGFFAPGLDFVIAQRLGLNPSVQRTLVGFMGCAAAFNAIRLASQITSAQPDARVLVVCVELCTLHIQPTDDRKSLTVASLFADGAAACVVGMPSADTTSDYFVLNRLHSQVLPDSQDAMAWQIGNHGFVMDLSSQVPRYIETLAPQALETLLSDQPAPEFWAIHPGGRAIVDRLASLLELTPAQTAASYNTLRRYGNMSSPTILFVLRELMNELRSSGKPTNGVAAAFGPGLVTELAALSYVPAPVVAEPQDRAEFELQHVA